MESTELNPELEAAFEKGMREWDNHRRKQAIKHLFKKGHLCDELYDCNWFGRAFYWLKTLICLLLNRTGGDYLESDSFCIVYWGNTPGPEYGDCWDACWIMPGIRNWQVCICSDSSY